MTTKDSRGRSRSDAEITSVTAIRPDVRPDPTTNPPFTSDFGSVRKPNDGALQGTTPHQRRRVRDLGRLSKQLSDRDWAILRSVAEHGYLTMSHIHVLHFGQMPTASGLRTAQRVLARLRRDRVLASLKQRIGGHQSGSNATIHYVDEIGDRLLRHASHRQTRRPFREPTERFLDHQLSIADAHVTLVQAERERQLELLRCDIEPTSWRSYVGVGGARLTLKPDLYAETATSPDSDYVDAAFVEIDKGTESIPTLIRKCREYEAYRRQGIEQEAADGAFPTVIWSMTAATAPKAERRRIALRDAIATDRHLPDRLFQVITPHELIPAMQKGAEYDR
ncbi:replication-relaxation family protein [Nocardia mangyaensis]|uniref:replication-relaxation family protein n=1 Tax=Nocardia mangyaensis TaxID=2213200 RepID=UPI00267473D1|nr:replication-relaxation family protein [Nocardia mangyaensis]MDO3645662.1 replication-relaxation family protein [Nocardia mangyaensis]